MTSLLSSIASLVGRRPRLATAAIFLSLIVLIGGAVSAGGAFKDDFTVPGIESQRAQDLLEQRFPSQSGTSATLVFSADDGKLSERAIQPALAKIADQPHVVSVDDLRLSKDGRTAYASVGYDQTAEKLDASARERLEDATAGLKKSGVGVAMSGEPIDGAATGGFPIGEVIGLVIAIVLLIAVLRSLRAAGNALLAAFAGLGLGFGALMWAAAATDVPGLAPTLAGMLGLGAGIDYALLLASRQQEELRAGHDPVEAARRANATAGHSAVTAAGIVLVSISGLLVTGIPFVGRAGVAAGLVVLACAVMCVVLLPARFARSGRRLLPRKERAGTQIAPKARTARAPWATRRPGLALMAAGAVTIALAAPAAGLELGQPDDRNLSTDATQRQAYDRLSAGFGAGVNGPLAVAVTLPEDGARPALQRLEQGIAADREVADVAAPVVNRAGDTAVITVTPQHGPQDDATRDARRPAARRDDPDRAAGHRRARLRRRAHRALRRRGREDRLPDPAVRGRRRRAVAAAPAGDVPVVAGLAAVGAVQPALDRRRLRRGRARVPDRDGREPARRRAAAGRPLRAAVHVRDPVRALDGLQRVPDLASPRGVEPSTLTTAPRSRRPRPGRARSSRPRARS